MPEPTQSQKLSLLEAAQGDPDKHERYLKRFQWGEPIPYIIGQFKFRNRIFKSDRRAYITDPELTHLVDVVLQAIDAFEKKHQRTPTLAEFGFGGGAISISIQLERPNVSITGVDIDASALGLGQENCQLHSVNIPTLESDFFQSWPDTLPPPDIIYGDPPWGNEDDLYDAERSAHYYHQMPPASAFPADGGQCSIHEQLLENVRLKRWSSLILLNLGVLPKEKIEKLVADCPETAILQPHSSTNLLQCRVHH